MVAGHLTLKNGRYYAVLNYRNAGGQRKTKWISLGLSEKGNKRKAEAELARLRAEFEPPKEVGDLSSDMLFADYLLEWLEIAKGRLAVATYSSYAAMIKKPVGPYFRQRNLTLRELEARHLQMFYSEMLRKVTPNTVIHYHAIIHSALKYAVKTDMLVQNVADKVDRPKENSFQPVFLSAEEMQKMFEALRGTKLELPVLVAAFYGFRRGEVLGLKWDAIDFERGTISVIRTVTTITVDAERYEYLVNKMAAIRWRGSDLDASYHAALFLMASHPALFQKMDRYLCPEGIDFTKMMRKEEFEYDWMKITADAARNLFSWNSKCAATPFEISRMPAPAIRALFTACFIANGDYMVSVRKNDKGEKVFEIDDSAGKRREAFNLQMEQMMEAPGMEPD